MSGNENLKEIAATVLKELDELGFRLASLSAQIATFEKVLAECMGVTCKISACKALYDPTYRQLYLYIPVAPPYLRVAWNRWPSQTNYREVRQLWYKYVCEALKGIELPLEPLEEALVAFKFTWGDTRIHDVDNYAVKFIIDALVRARVLADDNCERLSLVVFGERKNFWSTQVLVTPQLGQVTLITENMEYWEKKVTPEAAKNGKTEAQKDSGSKQNAV